MLLSFIQSFVHPPCKDRTQEYLVVNGYITKHVQSNSNIRNNFDYVVLMTINLTICSLAPLNFTPKTHELMTFPYLHSSGLLFTLKKITSNRCPTNRSNCPFGGSIRVVVLISGSFHLFVKTPASNKTKLFVQNI